MASRKAVNRKKKYCGMEYFEIAFESDNAIDDPLPDLNRFVPLLRKWIEADAEVVVNTYLVQESILNQFTYAPGSLNPVTDT